LKKNICMSFFLILFSQCSVATDSEKIFLDFFQGTWKTTDRAELWFSVQLDPSVVVIEGTIVNVDDKGTFIIAGTVKGTTTGTTVPIIIKFTFVEIEAEGILAVYEFVHDSKRLFVGIGIGLQDDILISSSVVISADLVKPTDKGDIFLIK